jgi:hypothetical protein
MTVQLEFKAVTTVTVDVTGPTYSLITLQKTRTNTVQQFRRWDGKELLVLEKKLGAKNRVEITLKTEPYLPKSVKTQEDSEKILGQGAFALTENEFYGELKTATAPFLYPEPPQNN